MNLRSIFTEPSKPASAAFRYGMLVFIVGLLVVSVWAYLRLALPYNERCLGVVLSLMLLFNHLAYQFRWPVPATVAIRILAWGWLVFGNIYVFFVIACSLFSGRGS
jgi:hypothetical protein